MATVLQALVPLALLLNGLAQARRAELPGACRVWGAVTVVGDSNLLWLALNFFHLPSHWPPGPAALAVGLLWYAGEAFLLNLVSWLLVLARLRRHPVPAAVLWQPWWATPAVTAGVSTAFRLLYTLGAIFQVYEYVRAAPGLLSALLLNSLLPRAVSE